MIREMLERRVKIIDEELERIEGHIAQARNDLRVLERRKGEFLADKHELTEALETGNVSL